MAPSWDDRHPFVTAEVFRTSTCTGEKLNSLGGISAALGDLNIVTMHDCAEVKTVNSLPNIRAGLPDEAVIWDDRRPFFSAKHLGGSISISAPK